MHFEPQDIVLDPLSGNLFSDVAEAAAEAISHSSKNKSSQLRKFYDELTLWYDKVFLGKSKEDRESTYHQSEPFIKMLKAKVAYAQGREHIDKDFKNLFDQLINQIHNPETLKYAKLFFEAVLGFRKATEKDSNK